MEKIVEQTLLYDFYGELLTDHQKMIYEAVIFDDMTYTEVAEEQGISRQGVFDLIRRCNHILEEYEEKLHLVEKFLQTRDKVKRIHELAGALKQNRDESVLDEILLIAEDIEANT